MPQKIVLIDYENIQPHLDALAKDKNIYARIFVGAQQDKILFNIATAIQKMGARAEYIKIKGTGKNALDFHIAYYIGTIAEKTPDAHFYIISKDQGYDPLVTHLQEKKINISRVETISEITTSQKKTAPKSKIDTVIEGLRNMGASRPKTLKTLGSTINNLFQGQLKTSEIDALIETLKQKKYITIKDTKLSYSLPQK